MATSEASTLSPFLPGTKLQYAWDSTSLGLFKTCPRLYQYTMILGYTARDESVHLRFGGEYHAALEAFDHALARGIPREAAIHDVVSNLVHRVWDWQVPPDAKASKYKNRDTLLGLVVDYLDHFNPDPAETYIRPNGKPAVELSFRFELEYGPTAGLVQTDSVQTAQPYLLCGHLDRVVTYDSKLFIIDRKTTTTTLSSYYFAQYSPNNQMSLYTLAGQIELSSPIAGVIIDAAQIKLEEPNAFSRHFTYRTDAQLTEWQQDLSFTLTLAEAYAEADYWPMNDTSCDKFGGCRFRKICTLDPHVRERFLKADFNKLEEQDKWNPLKPR